MGPLKFKDNLCVAPGLISETMDHFMTCKSYETPVFELVLMIQPLKVHHVPLIYSRQVNFVMFSFKTAI